jgi:hypothetical protein
MTGKAANTRRLGQACAAPFAVHLANGSYSSGNPRLQASSIFFRLLVCGRANLPVVDQRRSRESRLT